MLSRHTPESALRRSWVRYWLLRIARRWGKQVPLLLRAVPSLLRIFSLTSTAPRSNRSSYKRVVKTPPKRPFYMEPEGYTKT